jgi:L-fucose isomerase-like protein
MNQREIKIGVKPVFVNLVHSAAYEGPCRVGDKEKMDPETERKNGEKSFKAFVERVRSNLSPDAVLLDPVRLDWTDDWVLRDSEMDKLQAALEDVDLFLIGGGLSQYPAAKIAHRYRKPIAILGQVVAVDVSAYLRSRGLEGYAPMDFDELNHLISLMRVRKGVANTRILLATEGDIIPLGVVSTISDLDDLERRFGIEHFAIPSSSIFERMDSPSEAEKERAQTMTDDLIRNAKGVHMEREDILQSVRFYVAARAMMEETECNALSIPCFEICARRIAEENRVTFCLAHTLLKDEGLPSACEGDVNVLVSMAVLMYLSGGTAYMGNSSALDRENNVMVIGHDVPGLKMKGFDGDDLPYEIRSFTVGGWGVTIRYDFSQDEGQPVTMARFDPAARKLLVCEGEICGGRGFDEIGCTLGVHVKVKDVEDLFHKEQDFGHHLAMVYGHYARDLKMLGEIMGFEVVESG